MFFILIFLLAIVAANLSVAHFGPASTPINAFLFIGLDLTTRDKIHERWHGRQLWLKMLGLVLVGAVITYLFNRGAGMICIASVVAFSGALIMDAIVYERLFKKNKLVKINGSNIASSAIDSIIFPMIAFGAFMPWIILGQFVAKVFGGALWSFVLFKKSNQPLTKLLKACGI